MQLTINPKFKNLIPPLSSEELELLKDSIIKEGVRDSLLVWNGTLIDGHNRFSICSALNLPFKTSEIDFEDEQAAELWILRNQLGRRNLPDVERARIALKLKGAISEKARKRMIAGIKQDPPPIFAEGGSKGETRKEIAKIAGLSHGTISKVDTVDRTAPEPLKQAMGTIISIDSAYRFNKELQKTSEPEREEKANYFVETEIARKKKELDEEARELCRRQRIATKLENMLTVCEDGSLVTDENVQIMIAESRLKIAEWLEQVERAIELMKSMKAFLLKNNEIRRVK